MTTLPFTAELALVVRDGPYSRRSARARLDFALAAASLEMQLELFFIGAGVQQIIAGGEPADALLPAGLKAWKSLPEMTEIGVWVDDRYWGALCQPGVTLLLPAEPLSAAAMSQRWSACDRVLVI